MKIKNKKSHKKKDVFQKRLDEASRIVKAWPIWKQCVLGSTCSSSYDITKEDQVKRNNFNNRGDALIILVLFLLLIGYVGSLALKDDNIAKQEIELLYNIDEVDVFLKSKNMERVDFTKSKVLRKQFIQWRDQ